MTDIESLTTEIKKLKDEKSHLERALEEAEENNAVAANAGITLLNENTVSLRSLSEYPELMEDDTFVSRSTKTPSKS